MGGSRQSEPDLRPGQGRFIISTCSTPAPTLRIAQVRYERAGPVRRVRARHRQAPDAATLRGLERRFAERCRSSPATGARSRAARARSASGWRGSSSTCATSRAAGWTCRTATPRIAGGAPRTPAAAERPARRRRAFIVGLVLTYYRRHPQRARTRLLDLLGEVLTTPPLRS
jgi:hypothetical protein